MDRRGEGVFRAMEVVDSVYQGREFAGFEREGLASEDARADIAADDAGHKSKEDFVGLERCDNIFREGVVGIPFMVIVRLGRWKLEEQRGGQNGEVEEVSCLHRSSF